MRGLPGGLAGGLPWLFEIHGVDETHCCLGALGGSLPPLLRSGKRLP